MVMGPLGRMAPAENMLNMSAADESHGIRHCPVSFMVAAILNRVAVQFQERFEGGV